MIIINKLFSQKPGNGTYTYTVAFAEWSGKSFGTTCTVIIKGDSVWVLTDESKSLGGAKGEIIDKGILIKHKSGKWIIAKSENDKNAAEVGGCSDGPRVIDIKRKKNWLC